MELSTIYMIVGFMLASYSIVANDAIQTLGTFLASNGKRPWWVLWLFTVGVLTAVIVYGWIAHGGDVSYGRLSSKFPVPTEFTWIHVLPPLVIVVLTRFGIPVSTTFLVLTVFAPKQLSSILTKSLLGYAVAFTAGFAVYKLVASQMEKRFLESKDDGFDLSKANTKNSSSFQKWVVLQWVSTAFLWSQWLIQDLANIFVYMPTRKLTISHLIISLGVLLALHAIILYRRGGEIQKIVTSKTSTSDIRSATIIDFIYALILLFFKNLSNIPMSTTWVFLGLLAGRELAMTLNLKQRELSTVRKVIFSDAGKAAIGLAVSVVLALGLPILGKMKSSGPSNLTTQVRKIHP